MKISPLIVHPLPPAPVFVGRARQLAELESLWQGDAVRLISLIGLGGAGKTALARQFLNRIQQGHLKPPSALFVWSFYVDQDTGKFLQQACAYFTQSKPPESADIGVLYQLDAALANAPDALLVLDGLERVQRELHPGPKTGLQRGLFGELEDPLMKQFATQFVHGKSKAKCLITSRFPLTDVAAWQHDNYVSISLNQLERDEARTLLRQRGVSGEDNLLDPILDSFGCHALTIDRLGTFLNKFCGGDPNWAALIPEPSGESASPEERKLARVLSAYQSRLDERELALLSRICLFRFGITVNSLCELLIRAKSSADVAGPLAGYRKIDIERLAQRLIDIDLIQREPDGALTAHAAIRDHFYRLILDTRELHNDARSIFERELGIGFDRFSGDLAEPWHEVLAAAPREEEERDHRYKREYEGEEEDEDAEEAEPWDPHAFRHACYQLAAIIERKLQTDGHVLTPADHEQFRKVITILHSGKVQKILGLGGYGNVSLFSRPGRQRDRLPRDKRTLDLLEELIYHSVQAGDIKGALHIYHNHIGGRHFLANILGQYARGLRILRYFHPCPEDQLQDLAWYLRGAGELRAALDVMNDARPIWSGTILCLLGRLSHLKPLHWEQSRIIGDFYKDKLAKHPPIRPPEQRGKHTIFSPYLGWGEAIVDAEFVLLTGDVPKATVIARAGVEYFDDVSKRMPEAIRSRLALAEALRWSREYAQAGEHLAVAEEWILNSGSVEHTILLNLIRTRMARDHGDAAAANSACDRALHLAIECGFSLLHADLCFEAASLRLAAGNKSAARALCAAARYGITTAGQTPAQADLPIDELKVLGYDHPICSNVLAAKRFARLEDQL